MTITHLHIGIILGSSRQGGLARKLGNGSRQLPINAGMQRMKL